MPTLKDIEQFKSSLFELGNEQETLARWGEQLEEVTPPPRVMSDDLASLLEPSADDEAPPDLSLDTASGGEPDFSPATLLTRSHTDYTEGSSLGDMITENLIAERIAIDSYRHFIIYLRDQDPTTRRMLEAILATEEEHADDLADILLQLPAAPEADATADSGRAVKGAAPIKLIKKSAS